ncbi:MAG: imidazole glycerol phosphate synthase subunit HisH [Oscillospiraceae bacterium]|nr:imidazole glycerol phosphate synthase subunit HisH [Oscillospiraceae bacterium]
MVAIIDYGVGNLFSLQSSFAAIGEKVTVTADKEVLEKADCIILPGVGAFEDAAKKLRSTGLDKTLKTLAAQGKPLMGICLGMQLLFEKSYEYGCHEGLGLLKGSVRSIRDVIPRNYKIPHIGWNGLIMKKPSPLMKYVRPGDCVYFVHSYYAADCDSSVIATAEYGAELTAAVAEGNVLGCQFHPEKSGEVGLKILKAFVEMGEKK